jgi:hypothetical protein
MILHRGYMKSEAIFWRGNVGARVNHPTLPRDKHNSRLGVSAYLE